MYDQKKGLVSEGQIGAAVLGHSGQFVVRLDTWDPLEALHRLPDTQEAR